jgi:hypothetical protein
MLVALKLSWEQKEESSSSYAAEHSSKIVEVLQTISSLQQLMVSYSSSSQSVIKEISQLDEGHGKLHAIIDARYKETIDIFNQRLESLQQELTKVNSSTDY